MARGRGSATQRAVVVAAALAVACCCIAGRGVSAATYYVGDGNGWSLSSAGWPSGKQFHAGDVLGKSPQACKSQAFCYVFGRYILKV
jgi:hypothetical protein